MLIMILHSWTFSQVAITLLPVNRNIKLCLTKTYCMRKLSKKKQFDDYPYQIVFQE